MPDEYGPTGDESFWETVADMQAEERADQRAASDDMRFYHVADNGTAEPS